MKTIQDAINAVLAQPENLREKSYAELKNFSDTFGIYSNYWNETKFEERVKKYFVPGANWICTDTKVGLAVYIMDDEVIAVSRQSGRKCDESIAFVSKEAADKVKEFIITIMEENDVHIITNLNQDVSFWFDLKERNYER